MDTKLVSQIKIKSNENSLESEKAPEIEEVEKLIAKDIRDFLYNHEESTERFYLKLLNECFSKIRPRLENTKRWLKLTNNIFLDKRAKGYWVLDEGNQSGCHQDYSSSHNLNEVVNELNKKLADPINNWQIPTIEELKKLTKLKESDTPFATRRGRPSVDAYALYRTADCVQGFDCDEGYLKASSSGKSIPFLAISNINENSDKELFMDFIEKGLIPFSLDGDSNYKLLLAAYHIADDEYVNSYGANVKSLLLKKFNNQKTCGMEQELIESLLYEDSIRADIAPYHQKLIEDTELGHWSLWQEELDTSEMDTFELSKSLVARDPNSSINDGVIGIDFGTKSTVVVYQKDNVNIHPMRIGVGDLAKEVEPHHFENPTIMHFKDLERFISAYKANPNKPYTRWQDLTISHTAISSMLGSESSKFNTFLNELKQWAGDKNRKLKIIDNQGKVIDLPAFLDLSDDDFNPIEIYAYYLGLYINNQYNGIFMDYILSFPVTYEIPVRDKIVKSFERGLKKSLPKELGLEAINKLTVTKGTSEPAAYALVALQEYQIEPKENERAFYGVFDFGGGTTDFDFGLFREASGKKERRFDYVIEHFGAGGDKYLGGENLLELLAFEIFKYNKNKLLADSIQFNGHPERDAFPGSEKLISNSQEAKTNTKTLCEALRPFWEERSDSSLELCSGQISLNLTDIEGKQKVGYDIAVDETMLTNILSSRIEKGVENFFNALRLAFFNSLQQLDDIAVIQIFLAGNASQSSFVTALFKKHIAIQNSEMGTSTGEKDRFKLFPPLGIGSDNIEKPNCKTGVAFGLIESREGGRIKVIDWNIQEENIAFKFYLGEQRKNKFKPLIDPTTSYNKWIEFIDAELQKFELFYSEHPNASTGTVLTSDTSIKKKNIKLDMTDAEAFVYLRLVSPTKVEYVVAKEDEIKNNRYLNEIQRIEL